MGNLYESLAGKLSGVAKWLITKEKITNTITFLNQRHIELLIKVSRSVFRIVFVGFVVYIDLNLFFLAVNLCC
ncbi:hypothetical protein [Maribacter caenipelagi]|uniref:hypothetical protein n=1 Tax=Maribacter caenipelagi TaxID=1447781 RepID=UPI001FBA4AE5|nr:hypothetical protein [Maribacter caenipelagi]